MQIDESFSEEIFEVYNTIKMVYPGQYVPSLNGESFPDPNCVGKYISKEDFLNTPKWAASWVHWEDRCDKILSGEYDKIIPVHYEGIFTLLCNMLCPHCTRKSDRQSANAWISPGNDITNIDNVRASNNTLSFESIKHIIDELNHVMVDNQMGIVWGGGDPTMNDATYKGIAYARECGITSSLITNGVFLDVDKLSQAKPTLVRISLNCSEKATFNKFHGINPDWNYFEKLWANICEINRRKALGNGLNETLFGISLIVDERNLLDFNATIDNLAEITKKDGKGIDYIIIRPVMKYKQLQDADVCIEEDTISKEREAISSNSYAKKILKEIGIPLIPIKDSFSMPPSKDYYSDKQNCLAYGMCGEIRYNGDVQLCSDSYGNPSYTIGNILHESLTDILIGERRKKVLQEVNDAHCFSTTCPFNSRGHHLNRMFYQIEDLRKRGLIDVAKKWVEDMRKATFPIGHSFFI